MVTTYCTTADIFRFLQYRRRYGGTDFTTQTVPTQTDVEAFW